jgi:hypothetical protein
MISNGKTNIRVFCKTHKHLYLKYPMMLLFIKFIYIFAYYADNYNKSAYRRHA